MTATELPRLRYRLKALLYEIENMHSSLTEYEVI